MAAIIFDFDGTIADSFDYVAGFLAEEAHLQPLTDDQKQALRGHSMVAIARRFGLPWWGMFGLFLKGRRRMSRVIKHVKPFSGMPEVIEKLHAEGHELFILTSNTLHIARTFLHEQQLHTYFLEIYGGVGLFGKAPSLRRLLREQNIEKGDAVYIGDELRDVKAAQSIGLRVIGVTWGFARPSDLEAQKPTALAHKPADLINILEEL